jgi:sortase A
MKFLRYIEGLSWLAGVGLMGFFLSQLALGEVQRSSDVAAFKSAYTLAQPDLGLWSAERVAAWEKASAEVTPEVAAILNIPDLSLEVPVYLGAGDDNMDLGAGLISGTAAPGEVGNMGIAGHRDGYFRALKDIQVGQVMSVMSDQDLQQYRVSEILIVDPLDVEVLDPTDHQSLTLVTCYPFYFVGSAPQRFVVKADRVNVSNP